MTRLTPEEDAALWAGDLDALPSCECCCADHTWPTCRARLWNGCRSGLEYGEAGDHDYETRKAWAEHYGMTLEEFDVH